MRKILALILATILILTAVSVPVFAAGAPDQSNWSSLVMYGVEQFYIVVIPPEIVLNKVSTPKNGQTQGWIYGQQTIGVSDLICSGQEKLVITIASPDQYRLDDGRYLTDKGPWHLIDTTGESARVRYYTSTTQYFGEGDLPEDLAFRNGDEIFAVDRQDGNLGTVGSKGETKLYFSSRGTAQAGVYRDRLTFTVEVQNAGYSATESRH